MTRIIEHVTINSLSENQIMQMLQPPADAEIQSMKITLEGGKVDIETIDDMNMVVSLLITFFEEMSEPILGELTQKFLRTGNINQPEWLCTTWHSLIWQLPSLNRYVLHFLILGIQKISGDNENIKRQLYQLFGPALLHVTREAIANVSTLKKNRANRLSATFPFKSKTTSTTQKPIMIRNLERANTVIPDILDDCPYTDESEFISGICISNDILTKTFRNLVQHEKFLFEVEFNDMKFYDKDGALYLSCASLDRVIDKLLDDHYPELNFSNIFWMFLDYFSSPRILIYKLIDRFVVEGPEVETILPHWQIERRWRILNFVKHIFVNYRSSMEKNRKFRKSAKEFLRQQTYSQTEKVFMQKLRDLYPKAESLVTSSSFLMKRLLNLLLKKLPQRKESYCQEMNNQKSTNMMNYSVEKVKKKFKILLNNWHW